MNFRYRLSVLLAPWVASVGIAGAIVEPSSGSVRTSPGLRDSAPGLLRPSGELGDSAHAEESRTGVSQGRAESRWTVRDPFSIPGSGDRGGDEPGHRSGLRVAGSFAGASRRLALLEDPSGVGFIVAPGTVLPTLSTRVLAVDADGVLVADLAGGAVRWLRWDEEGDRWHDAEQR